VTRFERTSDDLDALIASCAQVPPDKRTAKHRARVRSALAAWKAKIAQMEAEVGRTRRR
jgi:CHASE3 domain sensor protein